MAAFSCLNIVVRQWKDENSIRKLSASQMECWNRGDIEDFMKMYRNKDSLVFVGKTGVQFGCHSYW